MSKSSVWTYRKIRKNLAEFIGEKAGGYTFMDYVKVGLPLQIIIGVVMTFVLPLLFPY